jgi:hypothetical protein
MPDTIYGVLNMSDVSTVATVGQQVIYETAAAIFAAHDAEVNRALSLFVQSPATTLYQETYKLLSGGTMQEMSEYGDPNAVKASGGYPVGYPLRDYQDKIAITRVTREKMTLGDYQVHVDNIRERHVTTVRRDMLSALLLKSNYTWKDPQYGDIAVKRLANTDGTLYAPKIGAPAAADDNHYLVSGYVTASISDTNNPFTAMITALTEHGAGDVAVFINTAEVAKVTALSSFVEAGDPYIRAGVTADALVRQLANAPGTYLGRVKGVGGRGAHVIQWDYIPATYMLGVNLDMPQPLKKRVDAETKLQGFGIIPGGNPQYPLQEAIYGERFGFGVAQRTGAVVMYLATGSTWTDPTISA